MATKRITELDPTTGLEGTDLFATAKGGEDFKATLDEVVDYMKDNFSEADVLLRLLEVDSNFSGLNSNFLQGFDANFFRNAANLLTGTVPDARLPSGAVSPTWASGGGYPNAGEFKDYIQIPPFILGGQRYMIQFGWSYFVPESSNISVTFRTPFASGWGNENTPLVFVIPECRRDGWSGATSRPDPRENIEIDVRLWYSTLTSFKASTKRDYGSESDQVRANWFAIGKY